MSEDTDLNRKDTKEVLKLVVITIDDESVFSQYIGVKDINDGFIERLKTALSYNKPEYPNINPVGVKFENQKHK